MADIAEKTESLVGTRGGALKAKPIMIYPESPEQRERFQAAADAEGRKMSNFMLFCAEQHIARRGMK